MPANTFGELFRVMTFGESHGAGLGGIIDGCPPGLPLCEADMQRALDLRKPGSGPTATKRKESDTVEILSGVFEGKTTGTPIAFLVRNQNQRSSDYEDLRRVNPHLIYCSLTGYGQTGPLRDAAGHDINYMSRSGIISHAGRADSGPSLMNFQIADIAVGSLNSVIGILAAVISRQATGKGQFIDVSKLDGCVPFNSQDGADFLVSGRQPRRDGQLLNGGSMYDYYETSDGGYMSVGSLEPKFWEAFCRGIGREDLIAGTVRPENVPEVKEEIRAIFRTKTRDEWTAVFSELDACVQPVMDLQEALLEDPQIRSRGMVVDVDMPLHEGTKVKQMATSINLSETPCEYRFAGYPLGYHTKEIIASLGLDYDDLQAKGVFD